MAGPDLVVNCGEETTRFSEAEALRLIAAGYAVPVVEPVLERAVKKPVTERRKQ
jgi:hypothetical protein